MSDQELVRVCADSEADAAWEEFVSRFRRPITLSILRICYQWGELATQVVDDLVQEVYIKLCTNDCGPLLEFAANHPEAIKAYIKTVAVNVAHDYFKALRSQKRGAGEAAKPLDEIQPLIPDDRSGAQLAIEKELLLNQIDRCLEECSAGPDQERDRMIFWMYYQQGLTAKAIAGLPAIGLTAKGVESAIFRLTRLVRDRVVGLQLEKKIETEQDGKGFRPATSY